MPKPTLESILVKRGDRIGQDGSIKKAASAPSSWNPEARTARFILTTENVDRYGDIVVQSGLLLDRFLENPQALMFHNSRNWPVGSWTDVAKVNGRPKRTEGTLQFMPEGEDEDADRAARHVAAKTIRTISIGFWPRDYEIIRDDDGFMVGIRFTESELLEASLVPIPANPDCLVKDAGGDMGFARELLEEVLEKYELVNGIAVPRKEYDMARTEIAGTKTTVTVPKASPSFIVPDVNRDTCKGLVGCVARFAAKHPQNEGSPLYKQIGDTPGKIASAEFDNEGLKLSVVFEKDGEEIEVTGLAGERVEVLGGLEGLEKAIENLLPDVATIVAESKDSAVQNTHRHVDKALLPRSETPTAMKASTQDEAVAFVGSLVVLNDSKENDAEPFSALREAKGEVIGSWIVTDGPNKGVHALAVEYLTDSYSGMFRGIRADRFDLVKDTKSTVTISVDTKDAEASLNRLGALADSITTKIQKLFASATVEKIEPTLDATPAAPSEDEVSEAKAKAKAVMDRLASKKLIEPA